MIRGTASLPKQRAFSFSIRHNTSGHKKKQTNTSTHWPETLLQPRENQRWAAFKLLFVYLSFTAYFYSTGSSCNTRIHLSRLLLIIWCDSLWPIFTRLMDLQSKNIFTGIILRIDFTAGNIDKHQCFTCHVVVSSSIHMYQPMSCIK